MGHGPAEVAASAGPKHTDSIRVATPLIGALMAKVAAEPSLRGTTSDEAARVLAEQGWNVGRAFNRLKEVESARVCYSQLPEMMATQDGGDSPPSRRGKRTDTDGRMDGRIDRWTDGRMDGWTDGWTDTDGRMDERTDEAGEAPQRATESAALLNWARERAVETIQRHSRGRSARKAVRKKQRTVAGEKIHNVTLWRRHAGEPLGLGVGFDSDGAMKLIAVKTGSPARYCNELQIGDRIIAVCGRPVSKNMSDTDWAELLANAPAKRIFITIGRMPKPGGATVPAWVAMEKALK